MRRQYIRTGYVVRGPGYTIYFLLIFCLVISLTSCGSIKKETRDLNCILIVIDALRSDHLGCYGYSRDTSPTMDKLSSDGIFISDVVSQSSHTAPAIASLFTGLYPYKHGIQFYPFNLSFNPATVHARPMLGDKQIPLAEYFHSSGYTTLGIVSNPWLIEDFNFNQGFEFYEYLEEIDGKLINQLFFDYLQDQLEGKNFFAYLHYMDVHAPYYKPGSFKGVFTEYKGDNIYAMGLVDAAEEDELEYCQALYDENILYVDNLINDIVCELNRTGIVEKTVIVITSDHGDEFFEHEGFGHGATLYQELINTFFIVYNPTHLGSQRVTGRTRVIDFAPALLDIFNISYDSQNMDGRSHLFRLSSEGERESRSTPIFTELGDRKAILYEDWKYIYNPFLKTEQLYNLKDDEGEAINRVDENSIVRKKLKDWVLNIVKKRLKSPEETIQIQKELYDKLRSLGYMKEGGQETGVADSVYRAVLDRIDFEKDDYNPLQLVYGWKEMEGINGRVACWIGPKARFVLMRKSRDQDKVRIEGNLLFKDTHKNAQRICLLSENRGLGEHMLTEEGAFSVSFDVPAQLGEQRALEFTLLCRDVTGNSSLVIASIHFE